MASILTVDQIGPTNPAVPVNVTGVSIPTYLGVPLMSVAPNTPTGTAQTALRITAGTGAPNNAEGSNGWIYFRSDGGASTTIYHKRAGVWVGVV